MEFNKKEFTDFRADFNAAMEPLKEKYGLEIEMKNISYTDYDFNFKVNAIKNDGKVDGNFEEFKKYCKSYGFTEDDYEREFMFKGTKYTLAGFNPRSPKNCCSIKRVSDGNMYKCGDSLVKNALGM